MEISEIILKTLAKAAKPLKGGEIATLSGIDKKEVDKSLKVLQKTGKIFSPQRCFHDIKK